FGSYQSPRALGKGNSQISIEPSAWGLVVTGSEPTILPHIDIAGRYGVTDTVDLGGRVGSTGLELDGKFQLTDPHSAGTVVSLAPSVAGFALSLGTDSVTSFGVNLPVLIGIPMGDSGKS